MSEQLNSDDHAGADESAEEENANEDGNKIELSEKGKRMAGSIAEYILMKYFFSDFREMKDRKRQQQVKAAFVLDMQFSLTTGQVTKAVGT